MNWRTDNPPKDGTWIWVIWDGDPYVAYCDDSKFWEIPAPGNSFAQVDANPTHWMPIVMPVSEAAQDFHKIAMDDFISELPEEEK